MITLNETLIIPDIRKTECFFYILCFQKTTTNTPSHRSKFDIALENYALRAQPTDQSLICYQINDSFVGCDVNYGLLANEKTDSEYNTFSRLFYRGDSYRANQ